MLRHTPDPVEQFIVTGKRRTHRDIHILVDRTNADLLRADPRNVGKPHRAPGTPSGLPVRLPAVITIRRVQRFLPGFTAVHTQACQIRLCAAVCIPRTVRRIRRPQFQRRRQLRLKLVQHAAGHRFHSDRFIDLFTVFPYFRVLVFLREIPAASCRDRRVVIVLSHPAAVRTDHIALDIDAREGVDPARMHRDADLARPAGDPAAKRIFRLACQYIPHSPGIHGKCGLLFQQIRPPEYNSVPEAFALPESRPSHSSLYTAEVLLHRVVKFKIRRIPDPICSAHAAPPCQMIIK